MPNSQEETTREHIRRSLTTILATTSANTCWQLAAGKLWDESIQPQFVGLLIEKGVPAPAVVALNYILRCIVVGIADALGNMLADFLIGLLAKLMCCGETCKDILQGVGDYCREFFSVQNCLKPAILNSLNGVLWQPLVDGASWVGEKITGNDNANSVAVSAVASPLILTSSFMFTFLMKKALKLKNPACFTNALSDWFFYLIGPLKLQGSDSGNRNVGYAAGFTVAATTVAETFDGVIYPRLVTCCGKRSDDMSATDIESAAPVEASAAPTSPSVLLRVKSCFWRCVQRCRRNEEAQPLMRASSLSV